MNDDDDCDSTLLDATPPIFFSSLCALEKEAR